MKQNLVSVIIPVYNSETFLKNSLDSILNQTWKNIEIIVIDDGSTDKSAEIIKKYADKITIISQPNQGLAKSLTSGIEKMSGQWIKWFSPDDVLYPNAIEILINEAKKLTENTIVYSNWEMIDENNTKLRTFVEPNYNSLDNFDYNVRLLDGQLININTTLIPYTLIQQGCKFQNLENPVAIDYDFFLRAGLLYNTNFHLIEKTLLKYRIHSKQLSHKNISNTLKFIEDQKQSVLSNVEKSLKTKYLISLKKYQKSQSISKKTMKIGLKILASTLPNEISDKLLLFYLNKIRRTRI